MKDWNLALNEWLQTWGVAPENLVWGNLLVGVLGMLLISYLMTQLFRYFVIPAVHKITARTKATWDDYLFNADMMRGFCRMIPPVVIYPLLSIVLQGFPYLLVICGKVCLVYAVVRALQLVNTFLRSLYEYSNEHESLRNRPLKGIYQMINILAIGVGVILIISILIDRNATSILAGLGASAAVLMLIFRDSILGLVAGVQLSSNDMLRKGDWITVPQSGADGYVEEISLSTVKVRNFDNTITTIPPYSLISQSFQNWRGMQTSGGRRVRRSLLIDMTTIHRCSEQECREIASTGLIDVAACPENERVNLILFCRAMECFLRSEDELVNTDMKLMVRQMPVTAQGLPVEFYFFLRDKEWVTYEHNMSTLLARIMTLVPHFGLKLYQAPSGRDLLTLNAAGEAESQHVSDVPSGR